MLLLCSLGGKRSFDWGEQRRRILIIAIILRTLPNGRYDSRGLHPHAHLVHLTPELDDAVGMAQRQLTGVDVQPLRMGGVKESLESLCLHSLCPFAHSQNQVEIVLGFYAHVKCRMQRMCSVRELDNSGPRGKTLVDAGRTSPLVSLGVFVVYRVDVLCRPTGSTSH